MQLFPGHAEPMGVLLYDFTSQKSRATKNMAIQGPGPPAVSPPSLAVEAQRLGCVSSRHWGSDLPRRLKLQQPSESHQPPVVLLFGGLQLVGCYTFLSAFRLPWPASCCLKQSTPFMGSDERPLWHFNPTFGSSHSASSAYQKWPTWHSDSLCNFTQASHTSHPFKV